MRSTDLINIETHLNWIENLQQNRENIYYAVECNNEIVGAIYITAIDYVNKSCSWGLYFKNKVHPFLSSFSAYLIIDKIFNNLEFENLFLDVNKENTHVYKFDINLGFKPLNKHNNNQTFIKMGQKKSDWNANKKNSLLSIIYKKLQSIEYKFIEKV